MTVHEVSKLAGVSIRTLQYYDKIGLLHPTGYTDAGYRLYDDTDLERLQHILLFKELEFPLKDIKAIINSSGFDRSKALEQQIELLRLKKEHIENLMNFALGIKMLGVKHMDFKAFDRSKLDEYSRQAKELYGNTSEYKEMEEKQKNSLVIERNKVKDQFSQIDVQLKRRFDLIPNLVECVKEYKNYEKGISNCSSCCKL